MHPELLNNPTFLRYHEMWQRDPKSLVFAPLAEFYCLYKLYADARKVCEAAVRHNPNSVLAHYSLAKAYLCTREWHSARHEAQWILARTSNHQGALDVLRHVDQHQVPTRRMVVQPEVMPAKRVEVIPRKLGPSGAGPVLISRDKTREQASEFLIAPAPMEEIVKVMEHSGGSSFPASIVGVAAGGAETSSEGPPLLRGDGRSAATGPAATPTMEKKTTVKPMPWQTVTMAKIYSQQGLYFKARTIYKTILSRDPRNAEAQAGLATLERKMRDAAA